jgi:hypothetical protein
LAITLCHHCGFIFNGDFESKLVCYDQTYENDQSLSPAFRGHMKWVADTILGETRVRNVIEVGCGQGRFLELLVETSRGRLSCQGFDPAFPQRTLPSQIAIAPTLFSAEAVAPGARPDAVISRHVIEHIPRPVEFLSRTRTSIDGSSDWQLFIESPNVDWILSNLAVHDFFYEHCSYFSDQSIRIALSRAGFETVKVERAFDGQYLLAVARPGTVNPGPSVEPHRVRESALHFRKKMPEVAELWRRRVEAAGRNGGAVAWGAGAKGISFSLLTDVRGELLAGLVDISERKQNRYSPISGLRVLPPREVAFDRLSTVFVMNPMYRREIETMLNELGSRPEIIVI